MKTNKKRGFTIVELVIVIAVIAILAAVLIPTFSGVVEKAKDSSALQDARNAYTQMTVVAASNGTTVENGTILGKDGRYFTLTNGELVKATNTPSLPKTTTLDNGVIVYGDTGVEIGDKSLITDGSSQNPNPSSFFTTNEDRLVYVTIDATEANVARTLVVKDSNGNIVYNKTYAVTGSDQPTRFYFSMYYNYTGSPGFERTNTIVYEAGDATNITTKEAAKGWYTYTFTYGTTTKTGYFYYE